MNADPWSGPPALPVQPSSPLLSTAFDSEEVRTVTASDDKSSFDSDHRPNGVTSAYCHWTVVCVDIPEPHFPVVAGGGPMALR